MRSIQHVPALPGDCGFVYFIGAGDNFEETHHDAVKIGITADTSPFKRLRQLQASSPARLHVWAAIPACTPDDLRQAERQLHRLFAQERQHGEWFKLSPPVLRAVRLARASWGKPDSEGIPRHCLEQRAHRAERIAALDEWQELAQEWANRHRAVLRPFMKGFQTAPPVELADSIPSALKWRSAGDFVEAYANTEPAIGPTA